jgi:ankyrin repeat protein
LLNLQETTGVKYFTKKDLAGCVSANKKTKTQLKTKKIGTHSKQRQNGGVIITASISREYPTDRCVICHENFDELLNEGKGFKIDECSHEICTTCAIRWFVVKTKKTCPNCRTVINVDRVKEQLGIIDVFKAIAEGNIDKVKQYIELVGDVNAKDEDDNTLLHLVPSDALSSFAIVKYLVENNADVNAKNIDGMTPLHVICDTNGGHPPTNIDIKIFKYLVDKGANVNSKTGRGLTPLHYTSAGIEILKILIKNDADVNAKDEDGWTPLHTACWYESLEIVKCLVNNRADVNAKNNDGETPLHYACDNSDYAYTIFKYLVDKGADINAKNKHGKTPGDIARQEEHLDIVNYLANKGV